MDSRAQVVRIGKTMNRTIQIFLSLVATSLISCSTSSVKTNSVEGKKPSHEVFPLLSSFQIHRYIFDNGLKLLIIEDHSSPTLAYQTWFKVGSRNEIPGKTGLAHLFEHMMFKETKNLKDGEFDRLLESAGAEGENAFTSHDYTAYVQEMPKEKLELITRLEADRMVNLVVSPLSFKTEREVVQNERRFRNENSPDGLMEQELFHLAFEKHSYKWPIIGYQEDLNRMTEKDALTFYHKFYSPNHATVLIVGDVNHSATAELVQKYYGHLKAQPESEQVISTEPEQKSPRRKQLKLNIQVEKLLLGYPMPEVKNADIPALMVMQNLLVGGKSSRLQQTLVETGIASGVDSIDFDNKDPSLFSIVCNLQKGKHAVQAESVILKELLRMEKEPASEQELQRAKNRIDFSYFESLSSNSEKALFFGRFEALTGNFLDGIVLRDQIQKISAQDVQRVAKTYFSPQRRTVITGVKK